MKKEMWHLIIPLSLWLLAFIFISGAYAGEFGIDSVTGYAVSENGKTTPFGIQSLVIMVLFFSNIVTMFFLVRAKLTNN